MRLKPLVQHCVMAGLLALPFSASAVGLGKLALQSGLGQPLAAEVELTSIQPGELDSLTARLADQRTYAQNKVEYGAALTRVRIALERRGGTPVLKVSSTQPINEPFLDLLIELNWNTGRLLREYTFLLDPPGAATASAVEPAPTIVAQPVTPAAPGPAAAAPAPTPAPVPAQPAKPAAATATFAGTNAPAAAAGGDTYGPVKRGETLARIAGHVKPEGATLDQMLAALYRANAEAFDGKNMNRLRAGGILKVPKAEEVNSIPSTEAVKEVRLQAADWRAYRDKLAAAAPSAAEGEGVRQVTGARITTAAADNALPAATADRLRLSHADATAGGAGVAAARAENLAASQKALADANSRVVDLEKQVRDLQRLLELKNSTLQAQQAAAEQAKGAAKATAPTAAATLAAATPAAATQSVAGAAPTPSTPPVNAAPAAAPVPAPAPTAEAAPASDALKAAAEAAREAARADAAKVEGPKAAGATKAASDKADKAADKGEKVADKADIDTARADATKAKPILRPPAAQQEPSFVDDLVGNPMYLVLAGSAIGLGGLAWALARRRRNTATKFEDSIGAGTDIRTSTVFGNTGGGVVNTGDNSLVSDFSREGLGNIDTGEVDPIAEAEVYLAYGRDNQAEEILKDALQKTPDRQEIRLKLLEIYAQQNKTTAFEETANEIHKATGSTGEVWAKAAQLGRGIDPANPLYADKGERVSDGGASLAAMADLGSPEPQASVAAAVEKTASEAELAFPEPRKDKDKDKDKEVLVVPPALTLPDTQPHTVAPLGAMGPATLTAPLAAAAAASVAAANAPQATALHDRTPLDFKLDSPPPEPANQPAPAMDFVTLDGPITLTGATTLSGPSTLAGVTLATPSIDIWGEKPLTAVNDKIEVTPGAPGEPLEVRSSDITKPAVASAVASGVVSLSGFSPLTTSTVTRAPQPAGKLDLDKLDLSFDPSRKIADDPTPSVLDGQWHDAATKLDLAKAYQEMGDVDGAREILQEVIQEGDESQKKEAQTFLSRLRA